MNIALILSTLVISAAAINSGDNSQLLSPQLAPPTSDLPLPPIQKNSTTPKTKTHSPLQDAQDRNTQRSQSRTSRSTGSYGRSQQQYGQNMPPLMPIAPTDSAAGSQIGQSYQYLPPTSRSAVGDAGSGGRSSGMYGPSGVPTSPTHARPGEPQSYTSMQTITQQNRIQSAARNATAASPQLTAKPFSGSTQRSSTTSPYMNLFRSGNSNGTIDNYTTLVRPELDQQRANQKFGADIHGLENSTHVQGLNIQQLNRDTQSLQGVNATQYYMNYGDFYQGAR
jgi:hypothetical protein